MDKLEKIMREVVEQGNPCDTCKEKTWACWIISCEDYGAYIHAEDRLQRLRDKHEGDYTK